MENDEKTPTVSIEQALDIGYLATVVFANMTKTQGGAVLKSSLSKKEFQNEVAKLFNIEFKSGNGNPEHILLLEKFYREVLRKEVLFSDIIFPERNDVTGRMVVIPELNFDEMIENIASFFNVNECRYKKNDNIQKMQQRPSGIYAFSYAETDEPDNKHCGKSQNDALKDCFLFADHIEYVLMTAFYKFTKGKFMDVKGWTSTSSRWSDGRLLDGRCHSGNFGLVLDDGDVDYSLLGRCPRELFL